MNNKAFIPLYLNTSIMNNLFTVVIEQFAEIQSENVKEQIILSLDTPLSELVKGEYTQGDLRIQVSNEFSTEKTEKKVNTMIKLLNMLNSNKLLKDIESGDDLKNLKNGEYVHINCKLQEDPSVNFVQKFIKNLEVDCVCRNNSLKKEADVQSEDYENMSKLLNIMKTDLQDYENCPSCKLISNSVCDSNVRLLMPVQKDFVEVGIDNMMSGNVYILGKVLSLWKENDEKNINLPYLNHFQYLENQSFQNYASRFLTGTGLNRNIKDLRFIEQDKEYMEVVPILIYF